MEVWKRTTPLGESYYYKAWVLVRFSKKEHTEKLKEVVNSQLKLVDHYISEGEKYERERNISLAMKNYIYAIEPLLIIQEREKELINLIPDLYNKVKIIVADLKNRIININSKIEIKSLTPSLRVIMGKKAEEPIKVLVIYKENGKEYPLKEFSLNFEFVKGGGEVDKVRITDNNGIALSNIYKVSKGENIVEVRPEGWESSIISIPKARISIVGVPSVSLLKFAVYFEENILGEIKDSLKLESKLSEKLRERGFNIISQRIKRDTEENMINSARSYGADMLILGFAEITNVNWIATALYSTSCKVTIKVFSTEDKKILITFNIPNDKFKDTRGFGITEKDAIEDALSLNRAKGFFEYVAEKIEEILISEY